MRTIKLTCLVTSVIGLSGCAFTQGVLQGAYDHKADKECRAITSDSNSIHAQAKTNCVGGNYEPKPKIEAETKTKPKSLAENRE